MGYKRIGPIKRLAKRTIQKEIKRQEKEQRRKLSIEEKRRIKDKVFRKMRTRMALFGAVGLLGIGGMIGYNIGRQEVKTITEGDVIENTQETIPNPTRARDEFINTIKVDELPNIEDIREEVKNEISELGTPEEVLNYTKKLYVEEYNKNHEEKIDIEDIKIWKNSHDIVFYKDITKSGDSILRYCTEKQAKEQGIPIDGDNPIISVTIVKDGKDIEERVAQKLDGSFANVYDQDEDVKKDKKTTLETLGRVVLTGIDRATSMEQEGTSAQVKNEYKNRFIKAVTEYKEQYTGESKRLVDKDDVQL